MNAVAYAMATFLLLAASAVSAASTPDSDRDGVADAQDRCPTNSFEELSRGVDTDGCPLQSDADGIPDYRDWCPDTPRGVKVQATGCPINVSLNVDNHIFNSSSLHNIH